MVGAAAPIQNSRENPTELQSSRLSARSSRRAERDSSLRSDAVGRGSRFGEQVGFSDFRSAPSESRIRTSLRSMTAEGPGWRDSPISEKLRWTPSESRIQTCAAQDDGETHLSSF